jgi:hypothetical protein
MKKFLKPLQIRRAKNIWGTREKSSLFPYKRTAFFLGTPNFFGPSYFEVALTHISMVLIGICFIICHFNKKFQSQTWVNELNK